MANSFYAQLYLPPCDPVDCSPLAPLSMEFSTQEYWSRLLFPTPGDLSDLGIEPKSCESPAFAGGFCTTVPAGKPIFNMSQCQKHKV